MIRREIVMAFLEHEVKDLRKNARVLPVLLVFPILAVIFAVALAWTGPFLLAEAARDPAMSAMFRQVVALPEFQRFSLEEGFTRYLLRGLGGFFLLMPVAIASTAAAFSIVGEKNQRTLEPILATPISDREFLTGKLLVCLVPTVAVTWAAALLAVVLVDLISWSRDRVLLLPDRFWLGGIGLLAPLMGIAITLITMRFSARAVDPQTVVQTTALAILPGFVLMLGLFGKILLASFPSVMIAVVVMAVLDLWLFRRVERTFRREEILTRWK
jgi:ABC-2 type transport system permease protein